MSIAGTEHCTLLYNSYIEIKDGLGLFGSSFDTRSISIIGSLGNMSDLSLDVANSAINAVQSPVLDTSKITDTLSSAIESCPALRHIPGYNTMVNQVLAGQIVELPPLTLRSLLNELEDSLISSLTDSLDPDTFSAIDGLRTYQEDLNNAGISDNLDIIDEMEACLIASCGTLTALEKVGDTLRSQFKLTSGGSLDLESFTASTNLTTSKLELAFNSYVDKFSIF
jgi:hypothetical protein